MCSEKDESPSSSIKGGRASRRMNLEGSFLCAFFRRRRAVAFWPWGYARAQLQPTLCQERQHQHRSWPQFGSGRDFMLVAISAQDGLATNGVALACSALGRLMRVSILR